MKKNLTEIVFILDESGSMHSAKKDTIGGFNEFIETQKKLPGEANFTFVKFNTHSNLIYNGINLKDVSPLTEESYTPNGGTALLDAVGEAIDAIGKRLSELPEKSKASKVMFIILTDGEENSSNHEKYSKTGVVAEMVKHQTDKYSWNFLFMGSNIDAWSGASSINISNSYTTSTADISRSIKGASFYTANYRNSTADFNIENMSLSDEELDLGLSKLTNK